MPKYLVPLSPSCKFREVQRDICSIVTCWVKNQNWVKLAVVRRASQLCTVRDSKFELVKVRGSVCTRLTNDSFCTAEHSISGWQIEVALPEGLQGPAL